MVTIRELKAIEDSPFHACQSCLINNLYDKASYYLEWTLINLHFTANQASILGFLFGLFAAVLFTSNNYLLFVVAGFLLLLSQMMDLCDGRIMLYRKKKGLPDELFRQYGNFFDWTENIPPPLVLFCLSLSIIQNVTTLSPLIIIFVGFLSATFRFVYDGLGGLIELISRTVNIPYERFRYKQKNVLEFNKLIYSAKFLPILLITASTIDFIFGLKLTFLVWLLFAMMGLSVFVIRISSKGYLYDLFVKDREGINNLRRFGIKMFVSRLLKR